MSKKNVDGEVVEIVKGDIKELSQWLLQQELPVTLSRRDFALAVLRTENQRHLFMAGMTLGAEMMCECARTARMN